LNYCFFFTLFIFNLAFADIEVGASQSLTRVYAIDGVTPPAKLRSNIGLGIDFAGDIKYNENKFFIYGVSGKILHFNSPIEAKLSRNFTSINDYFIGLKKISENSQYSFKLGTENFLYYQYYNNQYQIIRATPLLMNLNLQKRLNSLKDLKYTVGLKSYLPFADKRDSGKVGYGSLVRLSYEMEENQAKFSPYLETEYAIKKIKQTSFSRLTISLGFTITIDIREKKSKLF